MSYAGEFTKRVNNLIDECEELYNQISKQSDLSPFQVKSYTDKIKTMAHGVSNYATQHNLKITFDHMQNLIEAAQIMTGIVQILAEDGQKEASDDIYEAKEAIALES